MKNVPYYVSEYAHNFLIPGVYFENRYIKLKELEKQYDVQEIAERVNYYAKVTKAFTLPEVNKVTIGNYKRIASASSAFKIYKPKKSIEITKPLFRVNGQQGFVNQADDVFYIFLIYHFYRSMHVTQGQ